jgi:outer membrane protein assembly factor BamB
MIFVLAEGAAYALEAASGRVAWRRYVGYDTQVVPRQVSGAAGGDVLLVDSVRDELVCVDVADGKLRWRLPLKEPAAAEPVAVGNRAFMPTRSGRLMLVDLEAGRSPGFVRLPHKLNVSPAADASRRHLYQAAEHSNLYILSAESGACEEVYYLAHEPGAIRVPPLPVSRFLIVAENHLLRDCTLHVFVTNEQGLSLKPVQTVPLDGHVHAAPQMAGRQLVVATDRGGLYTFDVGTPDKPKPLTPVAIKTAPADASSVVRFFHARGAELWIADDRLTKFEIQSAQQRLVPKWIKNSGDYFLQPLEAAGETFFHVRRRAGLPGVSVAAVRMSDGEPLWQSHLGAPLAGPPMLDSSRVTAANLTGAVFQLAQEGLRSGVADSSNDKKIDVRPPLSKVPGVVALAGGALGVTIPSDARHVAILDGSGQTRSIDLPFAAAVAPVAFKGHLLVPTLAGHVLLLDSQGNKMAEPFQPRLEAGARVEWRLPAVVGENEFVITDGGSHLFRVGLKDKPLPNLAALGEGAQLVDPIVSPLAAVDSVVYGVDARRRLVSFSLPDLAGGETWDLKSPAAWGPARVGQCVLVSTADNQLYCVNAQQQLVWQVPLSYGPLAGAPLADGDRLLLASTRGVVWAVSAADGQETTKVDVGQPLGAGPILMGDQLVLTGHDGTLHTLARPE